MALPDPEASSSRASEAFAWIAASVGAVVVGGFVLVLWAFTNGVLPDVVVSAFHLPLYGGMLALAVLCATLEFRRRRSRNSAPQGLPTGYGSLGAGVAIFVLALIVDLAWREGIGIQTPTEEGFAPSRLMIVVALALVAVAPLRAAYLIGPARVGPIPIALSGAFTLAAIGWPGGFSPAESPWLATDPDLPSTAGELWVMDADGRHQTRLLEAPEDVSLGYASWAPDGGRIAYTAFGIADGRGSDDAHIRAIAPDGSEETSLLDTQEWVWIPRLSPDGDAVYYTQEAPGGPFSGTGPVGPGVGAGPQGPLSIPLPQADLWRAPLSGDGAPVRLTDAAGDDRAPVPSPDGSRILFDSTRDGNTELYVVAADGSDPRRLTDDPGEDWGGSWSPDGTRIAFNSSRSGAMEIYVMNADGTDVERVTTDEGFSTSPTWSPDGTRLAFASRTPSGFGQIFSVGLDGTDRRDLSRSPSTDDQIWTGGWGPDGRIVFSRAPSPTAEGTWLARIDLGIAATLLSAALLAAVVVALAGVARPLGTITLAIAIGVALLAVPTEGWRFVPAGLAAGLGADLTAWRIRPPRRASVAAAVASVVFVLACGVAAFATTGLEWTPTILFGVAAAAGGIGWGLGVVASTGGTRGSVAEA